MKINIIIMHVKNKGPLFCMNQGIKKNPYLKSYEKNKFEGWFRE
jgi:hypothetical protein